MKTAELVKLCGEEVARAGVRASLTLNVPIGGKRPGKPGKDGLPPRVRVFAGVMGYLMDECPRSDRGCWTVRVDCMDLLVAIRKTGEDLKDVN